VYSEGCCDNLYELFDSKPMGMQGFKILMGVDIFKYFKQSFTSWNYKQGIIVKMGEWSSSLSRSSYKECIEI
jgi:hypothetical protein